jgi:hypothetical protein
MREPTQSTYGRWRKIYQSEMVDDSIREHAFYRHWFARIRWRGSLTEDELREVASYRRWIYPLSDLVDQLCTRMALTEVQVDWLLAMLPPDSYAADQLQALRCIRDPDVGWTESLACTLERRADWASRALLSQMPEALLDEAERTISISRRPVGIRRDLTRQLHLRRGMDVSDPALAAVPRRRVSYRAPNENPEQPALPPGLRKKVHDWMNIVSSVVNGYEYGVEEYRNDMSVRQGIHDLLASHALPGGSIASELRIADERFRFAVEPLSAPLASDADCDAFWYWSIPRTVVGDLRDDATEIGLI